VRTDQAVQASVVGDVVDVADPPLAVTPVNDGMEKYVLAQAAGVVDAIEASFVRVTTSGLLLAPLAPTVNALVKVCEVPLVLVAKLQLTRLVVAEHPVCAVASALVVYPAA
jgi:hypothetical protein